MVLLWMQLACPYKKTGVLKRDTCFFNLRHYAALGDHNEPGEY